MIHGHAVHIWQNDEFIYIQTLDERGLILNVERAPVAFGRQHVEDGLRTFQQWGFAPEAI